MKNQPDYKALFEAACKSLAEDHDFCPSPYKDIPGICADIKYNCIECWMQYFVERAEEQA